MYVPVLEIGECATERLVAYWPGTKIPAITLGVSSFGRPLIVFHNEQGEICSALGLGQDWSLRRWETVEDPEFCQIPPGNSEEH